MSIGEMSLAITCTLVIGMMAVFSYSLCKAASWASRQEEKEAAERAAAGADLTKSGN